MTVLDTYTVETPEGVDFRFTLAGIGSRFCATAIDLCIMVPLAAVLMFLGFMIAFSWASEAFLLATIFGVWLLVFWGYHPLFEAFKGRRTPGHMVMGLRVTRLDGGPISAMSALVRGFLWPFEVLFMPILSVASVFFSTNNQRLGDLAASSVVISDENTLLTPRARLQAAAYDPNAPFLSWDVSRISPDDTSVLRSFVERRSQIQYSARVQIAQQLAAKVRPLVTGAPDDWHAEALLEGIVAAKALRD